MLRIAKGRKFSKRLMAVFLLSAMAFCLTAFFQACQKRDETEIVKGLFRTITVLAEKKDRVKILSFLSPDYQDFEGRDREQTSDLLEYYFKNYQGIAIHLLDIFVDLSEGRAEVEADVLLSSGPLETLRKLVGLVGVYYRFNFKMEKSGREWKITYAAWREIDSNSLLPGSKVILKKLSFQRENKNLSLVRR